MNSLLLFSGGMDSVALAAWKRPSRLLTVDYGQQPASGEIRAAAAVANILGLRHDVLTVPLASLGSGDLAGASSVPLAPASDWWPYRNQLLITVAASRAITLNASSIWIATVRGDGIHADGRPEFVAAIDRLLSIQEGNIRVEAPAISLSTMELVRESGIDHRILAWAHSCHRAGWACGDCRGCNKHRDVWRELGYEPY